MSVSTPAVGQANGLTTAVNTIVAPKEAFETLAVSPTWGWAFLLTLVLMLVGSYFQGPATRHAAVASMQQSMKTSSLFANMTPQRKQAAIEQAGKPSFWSYFGVLFTVFVAVLLNTIVMLIANAVGRGQADFKRLWCGSMNIALPTFGVGYIVLAVVLMIRGADSFGSTSQVMSAMPGLGIFSAGLSPVTAAFLTGFSIFTIWGFFLNAMMMRVMAKTSAGVAYTFAAIILIGGAAIGAGFVSIAHGLGLA